MWRRRISLRTSASGRMLSGKSPDNVFGIFPNSCVTKRECKNPSLVTLGETFKTQFISILGGGHEFLVRSGIRRGSNASFDNLVSKLTQHDASPFQWAHALEPVRLPLLELRANHSLNPGLRKSLISGGTSAWKSKKSEKSKMSNRLTFEFAVKVRNQPFANCKLVGESCSFSWLTKPTSRLGRKLKNKVRR